MDLNGMKKVGRSKLRRDLTDPSLTPQLFQTHFIDSAGNHGSAKWKFYVLKKKFPLLFSFHSFLSSSVQKAYTYVICWTVTIYPKYRQDLSSTRPVCGVMAPRVRWSMSPAAHLTPDICQNVRPSANIDHRNVTQANSYYSDSAPLALAPSYQLSSNCTLN